MSPKKIFLVFKTHFDIGFTDLSSRVVAQYSTKMLEDVIAACKETKKLGKLKYVWTMPAWPLWYIVNNCSSKLKRELDVLIEEGQVVWHALPFTSHTDCCSQMEYTEGLVYAKKLAEMYHKPCSVSAKMTDVPGHSIMLPDILYQAGIRFLHLGCNEFATPPEVPEIFFWETPGGRQILTMYSKGGYGSGFEPPDDWQFPVWMALMHTNDNQGPQSADTILRILGQIQETYPDAEVVSGTMDDFYNELKQYDLRGVPVVKKDLADTWIHGVGSYPNEVRMLRESRRRITVLQALYAKRYLDGWEAEEKAESLLDSYYEEICLFEEHTWGADVKTWLGSERVYKKELFLEEKKKESCRFMEESWNEQRRRMHKAAEYLKEFEEYLNKGKQEGTYALFHAESSDYSGWVRLPDSLKKYDIYLNEKQLMCGKIDQNWCCYVEKLPGFVNHILQIQEKKEEIKRQSLSVFCEGTDIRVENHRYSLIFSKKTGDIYELFDKKINQAVLKAREQESIFSYRYDKYGYDDINEYLRCYGYHFSTWGIQDYGRENYPLCRHETFFPTFIKYEIEDNRISLYYINEESADKYGNASMVKVQITLPEFGDKIFVTLQLTDKQESPYVESGSFMIPFCGETADFRIQKGGALLNPSGDFVKKSNNCLYCLENGIVVMDKDKGVCIQTLDTPLTALGEPGIYQYRPEFIRPVHNSVYINLFNNMWGTNFPQWMGGNMAFRFEISSFKRNPAEEEKELMEMLQSCIDNVIVIKDIRKEDNICFPEGMKFLGARKFAQGICLYFSELWGKEETKTISAKGFWICPLNLRGQPEGKMKRDNIQISSVPYGMQAIYLVGKEKLHQ